MSSKPSLWPTRRAKERERRRATAPHHPARDGATSIRLARELMADRGIPVPAKHDVQSRGEEVAIAHLWNGRGIAYVRPRGARYRTTVSFGPRFWHCSECGKQDGPRCEHAGLVLESDALQKAKRSRGANADSEGA